MHNHRRNVAKAFGLTLDAIRLEKQVSQEELAFIAEIDRTYPSLLHRGLRCPTLDVVFRLATALEVSAGHMVELTDMEIRKTKASNP